jgi:lysophospholipase L1-like esterase
MKQLFVIIAALLMLAGCANMRGPVDNLAPIRAQIAGVEGKEWPDPEARFGKAITEFEERDAVDIPPQGAVLGVGSSSMRGWHSNIAEDLAPLVIIPRGFGGSNMNDVLHFMDRIVLPYKPSKILLYEGDNDIAGGHPVEQVVGTYIEFIDRVHAALPDTMIYIIAIKPSPSRANVWPQMQQANALLKAACDLDERLVFVDVATAMLDESGTVREDIFLNDRLHMNRTGYVIWRDVTRAALGLEPMTE